MLLCSWNSNWHGTWLCRQGEKCFEPPGCHLLLPADTKGHLNLFHLPFWPILKVCRLHSDSLMTLKWRGVNSTVLFTDAIAEHKQCSYSSLAFTCCCSWLVEMGLSQMPLFHVAHTEWVQVPSKGVRSAN